MWPFPRPVASLDTRPTWRRLAGVAGDILYPPVCLGCGEMSGTHGALCAGCWGSVHFIERPWCEITGMPFDHERGEGLISAAAIADPPDFRRARSAVFHSGVARKLAHRLKYADRADLAPMLAGWMLRVGGGLVAECDFIAAIPLHRRRLLARQYNQAAELARALSKHTGRPLVSGLFERKKATRRQVGLARQARIENLRGAFRIVPGRQNELQGRNVLLVDDVFTTGATANAAARALLRGGASEVSVLTFSRVASEGAETLYA